MTELVTPRLRIRGASSAEIRKIAQLNHADRSSSYLDGLSDKDREVIFRNTEAVQELLTRLAAVVGSGETVSYGALLGTEMIGYISLTNCRSQLPDLQIELAPNYQGQGYGYEFLSALTKFLFTSGYSCFRYAVMPNNQASIALVEKVGGQLQEPESEVESLLFRTYYIRKPI